MLVKVFHLGDNISYHLYEVIQVFFATNHDFVFVPNQDTNRISIENSDIEPLLFFGEDKGDLKRTVYKYLSKYLDFESPWGCMTGIRPAKIVNNLLDQGYSYDDARDYLEDRYYIRKDKIDLTIETTKNQRPFIVKQKENKRRIGFYSSIPFCPSRCTYCSFMSNPIKKYKKEVDIYLDLLEHEIKGTRKLIDEKDFVISSLYLGGGTPTSLNEDQFERYLSMLTSNLDLTSLEEFSVEAGRPDTITREKLKAGKEHGVNRISINPQTMNDKTLKIIGRNHTSQDIIDSFYLARQEGFDNINMDLIVGLPGEDIDDFKYTLEEIKKLDPESITIHTLSIKRAANLREDKDMQKLLNAYLVGDMLSLAISFAKDMDLLSYYMYKQKNMLGNHENLAYAKEGFFSPYNIHMMEEDQTILAVGCASVSKIVFDDSRLERAFNFKSLEEYIKRYDETIERKAALLKENSTVYN